MVGEIKTAFGASGFEVSSDGPAVTGVRFLGSASVPEDKVFTVREVLQRIDELRGGGK